MDRIFWATFTPVQRIPRYTLFQRDLHKNMPSCHPDNFLIDDAENVISKISRDISLMSPMKPVYDDHLKNASRESHDTGTLTSFISQLLS